MLNAMYALKYRKINSYFHFLRLRQIRQRLCELLKSAHLVSSPYFIINFQNLKSKPLLGHALFKKFMTMLPLNMLTLYLNALGLTSSQWHFDNAPQFIGVHGV